MKLTYLKISLIALVGLGLMTSCEKKFMDINTDPDRISTAPLPQLLTSAQVNLGFDAGSDLYRYSTLIAQQLSGQPAQPNQTYDYDRYNIQGSDENNLWGSVFASTLNDLETIIKQATTTGSPNYSGVAKILKAYQYQVLVDAFGDIPYSEAQQLTANTAPKYDKGETIYANLITLLDQGIAEVNTTASLLSPGSNSVIYPGPWATSKSNWVKFANTLKLRLYIHYTKKDPAFSNTAITTLINSGAPFFASNADNFQMSFFNTTKQQNPIMQFEQQGVRPNYLFANDRMITLMNSKSDPRRPFYFTPFPYNSTSFKGAKPGDPVSINFSRNHVYLKGPLVGTPTPNAAGALPAPGGSSGYTYTGDAPIRMLTFAEYNFIRAEAALRGAPGSAQTFFTAGITASLQNAGVAAADITTYLATNGTLSGPMAQQLQQIIEEKYIAEFGENMEPWTEYRRTGFPTLTAPFNAVFPAVPRSLFYPQSEIDLNPNAPAQKPDLSVRVFWDTP